MANIIYSIVNIPELPNTRTNDPKQKYAVDVPNIGLRHINHEDLFSIEQKFLHYNTVEGGVHAAAECQRSILFINSVGAGQVNEITIKFPPQPKDADTLELRLSGRILSILYIASVSGVDKKPQSNTGDNYFKWVFWDLVKQWIRIR